MADGNAETHKWSRAERKSVPDIDTTLCPNKELSQKRLTIIRVGHWEYWKETMCSGHDRSTILTKSQLRCMHKTKSVDIPAWTGGAYKTPFPVERLVSHSI